MYSIVSCRKPTDAWHQLMHSFKSTILVSILTNQGFTVWVSPPHPPSLWRGPPPAAAILWWGSQGLAELWHSTWSEPTEQSRQTASSGRTVLESQPPPHPPLPPGAWWQQHRRQSRAASTGPDESVVPCSTHMERWAQRYTCTVRTKTG